MDILHTQYNIGRQRFVRNVVLVGALLALLIPSFGEAVTFSKGISVTGNVLVVGVVTKGSGTFAIDYPLDPANKILFHSFVESPDVKNIYDGIATLDQSGRTIIKLPVYFLSLNKDFRYLVTPLYTPMPKLHLEKGAVMRTTWFGMYRVPTFTIAGGVPNGRISWQVTGIRHDPYILANPIIPVVEKGPNQIVKKGEYLFAGYKKQKNKKTKAAQKADTQASTTPSDSKKYVSIFEKLLTFFKLKK